MFDDQERAYSRCIYIKDFIKLSSYYLIRACIYVKSIVGRTATSHYITVAKTVSLSLTVLLYILEHSTYITLINSPLVYFAGGLLLCFADRAGAG